MKILLVANGYPPTAYGGVEVYSFDLVNELITKGHQVHVFCRESDFSRQDYEVIEEENHHLTVTRVVNDYKNLTDFSLTFIDDQIDATFAELIEFTKPQLVHFNHFIALSARLPLIAAKLNIPSVITLHDYWPICHRVNLINREGSLCPGPYQGGACEPCVFGTQLGQGTRSNKLLLLAKRVTTPAFRLKLRKILGQAGSSTPVVEHPQAINVFDNRNKLFREAILTTRRLLVPSQYMKVQFSSNGYPEERIEVIPLGIKIKDQSRKLNANNQKEIRLAFIGALIPLKGVDVLLKAFMDVEDDNLSLTIYGRDDIEPRSYAENLKELAKNDPRIRFMGPFAPEQRFDIYTGIDLLIIPSTAPESFSLVAREALSLGIPVIASSLGALPEVIFDDVNGFLFEPGNHQALAQIIKRIANNPQILSKLECPGPAKIMTLEEHAEQIIQIYQAVMVH